MTTLPPQPSVLSTRSGKLTLTLLCAVAFLDFVDASIVNLALPSIRHALHFSVQGVQWVPSAYLLTYGGFMLLGGRAADLLGRRRILVAGTVLLGLSSLVGGLAGSAGVLVGARLAQGLGAAMMLPAALVILTTTFKEGKDRHTAIGAWGAVGGLSAAAGVLLGGLLTEGPGWRWVMFVNPLACVLVLAGIFQLVSGEHHRSPLHNFDLLGAVLATGAMLLLVYAPVQAPTVGWGDADTIGELAGALVLLAAFVVNERRHRNPLVPLSIFRINGLGFADATYAGAVEAGQRVVAPFRALAEPIADLVRPMPYPEIYPPEQEGFHPTAASRTMLVDAVDRDATAAIVEHLEASTAPLRVAQLRVLGGAMARVPAEATAFAHRASRLMVNVTAVYGRPEEAEVHEAWVDRFAAVLRDGDARAYVNFLGDEGPARVREAYPGSTWERLAAIKGRYDPTNLFRLNQNIPPTNADPDDHNDPRAAA
jgi:MFS family permease